MRGHPGSCVQGWEKDPRSPADLRDQPPSLAHLWVEDDTGTGVLGHPGG